MNRFLICLFFVLSSCSNAVYASGYEYMQRFNTFKHWSEHLPSTPEEGFVHFINDNRPLSTKLRERWLYKLALSHDWINYVRYYRPSKDLSLQCYLQIARFNTNMATKAAHDGKLIWLTSGTLPPACDAMFNLLRDHGQITDALISQRIILALDAKNISLATYLLKQFSIPRLQDAQLLQDIDNNPSLIVRIQPGPLHGEFFLYGAKKLIGRDMNKAIALAAVAHQRRIMSEGQYQAFLAQVAMFKAMRDDKDTLQWFAKVNRAYYNDALLDWQIRYALKRRQWTRVEALIRMNRNIDTPCWQYWLARALEKRGDFTRAHQIYEKVSGLRQYYGFLASLRIHRAPSFQNEVVKPNQSLLRPYTPFMENVRKLYISHDLTQASRLINDFISELSKEEISAMAYWLSHDLKWDGKAVMLSNDERLSNQLSLRFPTPYYQSVAMFARSFDIPPEMIYAIMRQESGFRHDVVSPAGAHGLMQLMPQTARLVAKQLKLPLSNNQQLFTSHTNINLGVAYLNQLGKRFKKHPVLMAAAYNAGPGNVLRWIKSHPPEQMDIWVETIPWHETRNYIKNVVAFYAVYQYRIGGKPDLNPFLRPFIDKA